MSFFCGAGGSAEMAKVGKITLKNSCSLKAEKERSCFQVPGGYHNSSAPGTMSNNRKDLNCCRNFAPRICLYLPSLLLSKPSCESRWTQGVFSVTYYCELGCYSRWTMGSAV